MQFTFTFPVWKFATFSSEVDIYRKRTFIQNCCLVTCHSHYSETQVSQGFLRHCALKLQACLFLIVDIKYQQKKIYLATWIPQLYGGEGLERGIITLTRVTQIRIT